MNKLPWIKFWPSDWLSDEALRLVSPQARGLWIDLVCLMAKSERTGYLQVNGGVNPTLAQVGKLVGLSEAEITPIMSELKVAGVYSIEPETGIVYSRRMVRDRIEYEKASEFGKKGGNPRLKGVKGRLKARVDGEGKGPLASSFLHLASSDSEAVIKKLEMNPAYSGIDVRMQLAKAQEWCDANHRKCSYRFFVNWLNRAERPISADLVKPKPTQAEIDAEQARLMAMVKAQPDPFAKFKT